MVLMRSSTFIFTTAVHTHSVTFREAIRVHGYFRNKPIIVKETGEPNKFRLVEGRHRLKAVSQLNISTIPCHVLKKVALPNRPADVLNVLLCQEHTSTSSAAHCL